ncbi:MAG TPA: Rieske (2Fe-2S) protein [Pseudonocardia sp.]|nr:Rieske (2Fe-2S) protein [Pseudonocardia sp.]
MAEPLSARTGPTRRAVVAGGCGLVGGAVLSGCATYGPAGPAPAPAPTGAAAPAGTRLAGTADVPVGGGLVLAAQGVVLTQPEAGTFTAFGATCTHQGCAVTEVVGGTINCPCHGSKFAIADGSVTAGPAPSPLPTKPITVEGDGVLLA